MNLLNDTLCDSIFVCVCLGEGVARGGGVGLAMASPGSVEFVAAVVAARGDETQAATARGSPEDGPSHVPRPQGSLHVSGRGSNPPDFTPYFLPRLLGLLVNWS